MLGSGLWLSSEVCSRSVVEGSGSGLPPAPPLVQSLAAYPLHSTAAAADQGVALLWKHAAQQQCRAWEKTKQSTSEKILDDEEVSGRLIRKILG